MKKRKEKKRERRTYIQRKKWQWISINNNIKSKWNKCSNEKTQGRWMDKKTWPIYMLSTRHPPQNKRPTQAENEGIENVFYANGHEKKKQG